jgi:hypothetical protein
MRILDPIGQIETIVNSDYVLIRVTDPHHDLAEGATLLVFGLVSNPNLAEPLKIPKGRLLLSAS